MYKILDNLATHGIGEPGILKGYSECKQGSVDNFRIIDVRTLVDGPNPSFDYELNIMRAISYLEIDEKVVIYCRLGMSRSNAIALGVLVHYFKIDFNRALELIISKIPICNILTPHILTLQKLLNIRYTRCLKTDTLLYLG
jgi:protein-tyrosine phosphatase